MLQFRGSLVTFDAGLLAYRELDDVLGLTEMAGDVLADARSGKNGRHSLAGLFRQSVFGRLAGYEDVNGRDCRAARSPPMRCGSSFMHSPTTSAISCARWQRRTDQGLVADDLEGQADQDRREGGEPLMLSSRWPRSPSHGKCSKRFCGSSRNCGRSHHQR